MLKVASGAAGSVWRASFDGNPVAAKQLTAMSDLIGMQEALEELVNEVAILGQLNHPSVVKLLGLCKRSQDGIPQVFIVQEWCDRNLRSFMQSATFSERNKDSDKERSPASTKIALQLSCKQYERSSDRSAWSQVQSNIVVCARWSEILA